MLSLTQIDVLKPTRSAPNPRTPISCTSSPLHAMRFTREWVFHQKHTFFNNALMMPREWSCRQFLFTPKRTWFLSTANIRSARSEKMINYGGEGVEASIWNRYWCVCEKLEFRCMEKQFLRIISRDDDWGLVDSWWSLKRNSFIELRK